MTTNENITKATENLADWATERYNKYLAAGATDAEAILGVRQDMLKLVAR